MNPTFMTPDIGTSCFVNMARCC